MSNLKGKKALVIGGSRGIGAAIVRRLIADGASVTFTYAGSREKSESLASETGAVAVHVDAADRAALVGCIREADELDILVYNSGIFVGGDPTKLDPDEVDRMIDINVRGPYHSSVAAAQQMAEGGRIIVIGSTNGDRTPFPGSAAYSMTKSSLQGMARGLARDFGPRKITVNIVQPGPVDTDMNPANGPQADLMHSAMAIKTHSKAAEIAAYVAFIAGPEAASITGSMQTIDGGFAC